MSQTNGASGPPDPDRAELRKLRLQRKVLEERLQLEYVERAHKRRKQIRESEGWEWIGGIQDAVDGWSDGRDFALPFSTYQARRYGANWPFWRTWVEHARIRASARIIHTVSTLAQGALEGLTNYVVGGGFMYRPHAREGFTPPKQLLDAIKETIKEFSQENDWASQERELHIMLRRDGETFLHHFPQDDGILLVRQVLPEQIMEPASNYPPITSFGVINDEPDIYSIEAYNVALDGNQGDSDEVAAFGKGDGREDEILHTKINVDRMVKRGLTDFCFDTHDTIKGAGRLLDGLAEGTAIQANIALIRQHDMSTKAEVSGFAESQKHGSDRAERYGPGTILDMPKGINFTPSPFASSSQNFVAVAQAIMRVVGVKWSAPEWLVSGDASNNNYASSLTAESPFVKGCKAKQDHLAVQYLKTIRAAIKCKCDAGKMRAAGRVWSWREIEMIVDIKCEPPSIEVRDKNQEAQTNTARIAAGAFSPQLWCQEEGLDYDQVQQDLEDHRVRTGEAGGMSPLPIGDDNESGIVASGLGGQLGKGSMGEDQKNPLASLLGEAIREACVPNKSGQGHHDDKGRPCSTGSDDNAANQAGAAKGSPQEKVKGIAAKLGEKIKAGLKKALEGLDDESRGGVSFILGGIKGGNPKFVAAGASLIFSSVFRYVHEEVFETALSQHSIPGAAIVAKTAAGLLAKGESKLRSVLGMGEAKEQLSPLDEALIGVAIQSAAETLKELGVEAKSDMKERLVALMREEVENANG